MRIGAGARFTAQGELVFFLESVEFHFVRGERVPGAGFKIVHKNQRP